jgi:hypothetical protein
MRGVHSGFQKQEDEKPGATRKLRAYERVRRKIPRPTWDARRKRLGMRRRRGDGAERRQRRKRLGLRRGDGAERRVAAELLNTRYSSTRLLFSFLSACSSSCLSLPFDARGTTLRIVLAVASLPSL